MMLGYKMHMSSKANGRCHTSVLGIIITLRSFHCIDLFNRLVAPFDFYFFVENAKSISNNHPIENE